MTDPPPEIEVRRLVLKDEAGRVRAVLETVPPENSDPPNAPGVRLTLFAATGDPMLSVELTCDGEPRLSVGHPDRGTSVIVNRSEVSIWAGGNEVAVLSGGRLRLCNPDGAPVVVLPSPDSTE